MLYAKADKSINIPFEFKFGDDLVVPDASSVTLTVTEANGTVISGYDGLAITPDVGASQTVLSISAAANTKTNDFELRQCEVYFEYNSTPVTGYITYQIVDRINIPVSPSEVRNLIGISESEWPNENIDLIKAYSDLQDDIEDFDVETTLVSGESAAKTIIDAIKYKAAIQILPSLEIIAVQSLQADNVMFRRFEEVDFEAMRNRLTAEYDGFLSDITGESGVTPILATTGVGTDAVTGE